MRRYAIEPREVLDAQGAYWVMSIDGGSPGQQTATTPNKLPNLLTIAELAEHLGVDVRHVRRLVAERRIPFIKWGHLLRFDPAEIAAWIDRNRCHPGRPRP